MLVAGDFVGFCVAASGEGGETRVEGLIAGSGVGGGGRGRGGEEVKVVV